MKPIPAPSPSTASRRAPRRRSPSTASSTASSLPVRAGRGGATAVLGVVAAAALSSTLSASKAHAAAYYVGEIGARSLARGGANIVNPGDPSALWLNPAATALVPGVQLQVDLNLVWLQSEFVRDCGGVDNGCAVLDDIDRAYPDPLSGAADPARTVKLPGGGRRISDKVAPAEPGQLGARNTPSRFDGTSDATKNLAGVQPIPRLFATFNTDTLGLPGFAFGAFAYAPSSGDYSFDPEGTARYTLIDRDLLEVFYGVTAAWRYGDWIAVGGSLQGVTAGLNQSIRLGVDAAGNEDPGYDVQVRIAGEQHLIPSGNFGVWTNPLKPLFGIDLQLGASVQLPREVQATGKLTVEKVGDKAQAEFFDSGLATLDADNATATAQFSLPPFWRIGAKYVNADLLGDGKRTVGLDVELAGVLEQWSAYDHVFPTTQDITFSAAGAAPEPLPPIVQPKDWTDAVSVRAGATVALWDRMLELHGGGFYETSAIPDATYTVEVVCGDKVGVGAGVSASLGGVRLDVAYGHVFVFDRTVGQESIVTAGNVAPAALTGDNDPVTRVAMGTYRAGLDMLNVGLTVAFDEVFGFGAASSSAKAPAPASPEPAPTEPAPASAAPAPASPEPAPAPPEPEPAPASSSPGPSDRRGA